MEYGEFRRHLGKAGLTVNQFAAYLGVRPASVSNYSTAGVVPQTYAILAVLLGEAGDRGVSIPQLLGRFGVVPPISDKKNKVSQLDLFRNARASGNGEIGLQTNTDSLLVKRKRNVQRQRRP